MYFKRFKKIVSLTLSFILITSFLSFLDFGKTNVTATPFTKSSPSYNEAIVKNTKNSANTLMNATIYGDDAYIETDTQLGSKVLVLDGSGYGASWLKLPDNLYENVTDGFSVSMDVNIDASAVNYSRLFQSSSIPLGTGSGWFDAPDISIDIADGINFRHSVFVGKTTNTIDDAGKYRSMFSSSLPQNKGVWKNLTLVVSENEYSYYVDGVKATLSGNTTLPTVLSNLFSETENYLESYIYNAIGHSVYSGDSDMKAKYDNIAFYDYALSSSQINNLPDNSSYLYTFEDSSVTLFDGEDVVTGEDVYTDGTILSQETDLTLSSPDKSLVAKVWTDPSTGRFFFSTSKNEDVVLEASSLGITTTSTDLSKDLTLVNDSISFSSIDESYELISSSNGLVSNKCNELTFTLEHTNGDLLNVILRAYNDGFAYRYNLPLAQDESVSIIRETSEFVLPNNTNTWAFTQVNETYEGTFTKRSLSLLKNSSLDLSRPLLASVDSDKYWLLLTEANVFNQEDAYCASYFSTKMGEKNLGFRFGNGQTSNVVLNYPANTPWRVAIVTDNLNDLANSSLVPNLNDPSKIEDTSWIKPGKVAWSWWSSLGDDPIDYKSQKDYIDFAAENGWEYVCLDYGWVLWDDYEKKIEALCTYAENKGVSILLWYGVNNTNHTVSGAYPKYSLLDNETITREFELISKLGVKGVKVDYFNSDNQKTMNQMYMVADIASENKLMVVFHGNTNPNGEERTFPNIMTYEAVYGAEYYKWRNEPSVANCLIYPFTRNVVGPMDFTPTAYRVGNIDASFGFMLAQTVVYKSSLQHFAASVYVYEGYKGLSFLNDVETKWDESFLCEGYPGEYTSMARKTGNDWFIGTMTLEPRTTDISLSFLDEGEYNAYIYRENSNKNGVEIQELKVTSTDSINLSLLANDGAAIKLTKDEMITDTVYDETTYYEAEDAILEGATIVENNQYASNLKHVGWLGGSLTNTLTFNNVEVDKDGDYALKIFFISGQTRNLYVKVNNDEPIKIENLISNANDWVAINKKTIKISLKEGTNSIKLFNDESYAPSIDRIGVVEFEEGMIDNEEIPLDTDSSTDTSSDNDSKNNENNDSNDVDNVDTDDTDTIMLYLLLILTGSFIIAYFIFSKRKNIRE